MLIISLKYAGAMKVIVVPPVFLLFLTTASEYNIDLSSDINSTCTLNKTN